MRWRGGAVAVLTLAVVAGAWYGVPWGTRAVLGQAESSPSAPDPSAQGDAAPVVAAPSAAPHDTPVARAGAASAALAVVARRGDAAAPAPADTVTAQDLARHPHEVAASGHAPAIAAGQRIRVAGELAERLQGEAGVTVVVLATDAGPGLHLVWSPEHAAALDGLAAGHRVTADCLVQGEVLGRWILADCRL